ncbi:uncharacterized protein HHUB_3513 [Halobacterium hubeiense]|uniref:Uncharacterized protein n=1 Tax=Halobacterium hubeiense TaxID=1407499 RepID=A0A0U5H8K5_9EURY|nr:ribbon-helix-helix domain-containing protein [Halobacterium hubeiense]CQH61661.1 uncharacterized protein HHUB_3513 [Halobacterium hubeiense]
MRIPAEVDPDTYEQINQLVKQGAYASPNQFIRVAIQNQLDLEETDINSSEIGSQGGSADSLRTITGDQDATRPRTPSSTFEWGYQVPKTIPLETAFPLERDDQLLFSQYYRFLPLKFVLYELAKLYQSNDETITLSTFRSHIKNAVEPLRDEIVAWENEENVKKKNRKSAGFPKSDSNNPEQSMNRFLNHFVGKVQKTKSEPAGFGHELGVLAIKRDGGSESWRTWLTESGEEFLRYKNPLLAHGPEEPALSESERRFLVDHIRQNIDLEFEFMCYISDIISEVEGTYTSRMEDLHQFLAAEDALGEDITENQVRSQTGGTISRMVDLGILTRGDRRGHYNLEEHPEDFPEPSPSGKLE